MPVAADRSQFAPPCRSVYQWHMHVYSPKDDETALKRFQTSVSSRFSLDANVVMGRFALKAGGPHPCSQFEVGMISDCSRIANAPHKSVLVVRCSHTFSSHMPAV